LASICVYETEIKKLIWDIDFSELGIKSRGAKGNTVTKHAIKKIVLKEEGVSTLKPRKIWFDDTVMRLNIDDRGDLLGEFKPKDRLLIINQHGNLKTVIPEMTMHFDEDVIVLEKWEPNKPITVVYFDGQRERYYLKRFIIENPDKLEVIISDHPKSQLEMVSTDYRPVLEIQFSKRSLQTLEVNAEEFIDIKGVSALGNLLTKEKIKQINALEPLPYSEPELENIEVEEDVIENELPTKTTKIEEETKSNNDDPPVDEDGQTLLF
jgi:topoisomerase-4 subunit A